MFNKDFYPTPDVLVHKMIGKIKNKEGISTILEPSAGKGNIVDKILNYSSFRRASVDCIEKDEELQSFLKGKGYRLVYNDFLNFNTKKKYGLTIMNPPFSNEEKHLLKAIELMQYGGQIICLLNAETLRNICNIYRQDLINKLEELNADIEFIEDAFLEAERKTSVEVALIYIDIPHKLPDSDIFKNLQKAKELEKKKEEFSQDLAHSDFIKSIVERYNFEVELGVKLLQEFESLSSILKRSFGNEKFNTFIEVTINNDRNNLVNNFISTIRYKYWETLFQSDKFRNLSTSELRVKYEAQLNELKNYDFNEFNISQIQKDMESQIISSVENTILALFDKLSFQHSYNKEYLKNIHYYNGWKTNKAYKINKKVIIPLNAVDWYDKEFKYTHKTGETLADIEKVLNYINSKEVESIDLENTLREALNNGQNKNIDCKHFTVTFYKKGTCHIVFKDDDLLLKFNIFGSQRKGWLPPGYGKKNYSDMEKEEQEIIDEFQGKKEYEQVYNNPRLYSYNSQELLLLGN
ncbi:MAG: DUF4942 domain-containing protein [Fusobacterium sp.]|uniref:DUF4942 domain-containing protein n=1 Tax=Fusobacterium sp. TaxID=68766 RepID=UPI003992A2C7